MTPEPRPADLRQLAAATAEIYERNAKRFDVERPKGLHERAWLDRLLALVEPAGRILDVGCGAAEPIGTYLITAGHRVTGTDISHAMLALARARVPSGDWRHADMRTLDLGEQFAGILGWNSFFHLTPDEQRSTLPRLAEHLLPGGALMLTVGPAAGEVVGRVGDDTVYHASLAPEEYRSILERNDIGVVAFVAEDPECDRQSVLLAKKGDG